MMQARRENASYVELVETGKKLDKIEERKRKRTEKEGNNRPHSDDKAAGENNNSNKDINQRPKFISPPFLLFRHYQVLPAIHGKKL